MAHRVFSDASLARLGEHLQSIKATADSAASLSGDVAELSQLTADALVEYNTLLETKQNMPTSGTLTIPTSGWSSDSGVGGRFKYKVTVALADLETTDTVELTLANDTSVSAASTCGLSPWVESLTGSIRLRATKAPTASFTVNYTVTKPQS